LEDFHLILAIIGRVAAAGAYYSCVQFASEIFPTEIRGKGSSAFEIFGGIGLFIQPKINYLVRSRYF
jgi:MFS family permease